ncbi:MAG: GntR family transcriptional regulator [Burkholderiaceae bacterium]
MYNLWSVPVHGTLSSWTDRVIIHMETVATRIYQSIKNQIIEGFFPPGMRITEQNIAAEFSSSRTPVREALRVLAADGFLVFTPNSGTVVREWVPEQVREIFDLRSLIESEIAGLAAQKISRKDIESLKALQDKIELQGAIVTLENANRISPINREFHQIVAQAGQNERLVLMLAGAIEIPIVQQTFRRYSEKELLRSFRHHRELIDAFEARDSFWAKAVMSCHIHSAKHVLLGPDSADPIQP